MPERVDDPMPLLCTLQQVFKKNGTPFRELLICVSLRSSIEKQVATSVEQCSWLLSGNFHTQFENTYNSDNSLGWLTPCQTAFHRFYQ